MGIVAAIFIVGMMILGAKSGVRDPEFGEMFYGLCAFVATVSLASMAGKMYRLREKIEKWLEKEES